MNDRIFKILIVDDEPRYVQAVRVNLIASGYQVISAHNGQAAVDLAASESPDLVILDVRMPVLDGLSACKRIREFSAVPIIMLTAMASDMDKVKGLDLGADDYVTKPFNPEELLARVRSALRRVDTSERPLSQESYSTGDLRIDFVQQRVFMAGEEITLTPTEYRLLREMVMHARRVMVPAYLLENIWGPGYETDQHLVWQAIHRLRKKIEPDPNDPQYILTRPGMGYVFEPQMD
ncbi:MAG TPA: DNA-binding response regulator [Chloroflexi bacterium]|nr:DNA-binding response regulator [Chloroflexota bacterium]HBY07639.1 DNA-binding response regulator [Chloroflexota bacterium]